MGDFLRRNGFGSKFQRPWVISKGVMIRASPQLGLSGPFRPDRLGTSHGAWAPQRASKGFIAEGLGMKDILNVGEGEEKMHRCLQVKTNEIYRNTILGYVWMCWPLP